MPQPPSVIAGAVNGNARSEEGELRMTEKPRPDWVVAFEAVEQGWRVEGTA